MKRNNNGNDLRKRSTRFHLPNIKKDKRLVNNSKDTDEKQIHLLNSTPVIEQSIEELETNKHVQFSHNVAIVKKPKKFNETKRYSLPLDGTFNSNNPQSNFFPTILTGKLTDRSKNNDLLTASTFDRRLSFSTILPSYKIRSRHSSFSSNPFLEEKNPPPSILSSSNIIPLSSIELNSSLSEIDRQNLDDIRQIIPDEFEKLIPILIKLGVVILPQKFLEDNTEHMTIKEIIERHRVISLIKIYQENLQHQQYLQHLYGSIWSRNDTHQQQFLRETLSFQGQLALLYSYQDEIERQLNQKIKYWKTIPMISNQTNQSEYSYSTNKSSIRTNSVLIKRKSVQINPSIKSYPDLSLPINQNSIQMLIPDHIDHQWQRKLIVFIIEQGMILLDQVRLLSSTILPNISSNEQFIQQTLYDNNKFKLVKAFKQWTFLSSTLYT